MTGYAITGVKIMNHVHLCLTDLLDQDLSAYEYYQSLSPEIKRDLQEKEISTFGELQSAANQLKRFHPEVI